MPGMSDTPQLRLYNSLSRTVEPVHPIEKDRLRLYACGPTVYSHAHIGNFRTFVTVDLILRAAHSLGWQTTYVTNITDVGHLTDDDIADAEGEDKMAKALRSKEGEKFKNIWDLAAFYEKAVLADWHTLGLLEPDVRPRATQHIREQILAVEKLVQQGHAYETSQGVYFSIESFPSYGRLSGNQSAGQLEALVRDVVTDPDKQDPRDFALWKKDDKHLMQWYSPWGWGFPGWHIECSVMANVYLGETIDIHAGGEDLRFPHHECEIAQAESLSGKPFANHWVHSRFLQVEGQKMSKSLGNYFTVSDLTTPAEKGGKGYHPLAVRYALMSGHYRKPFNFTLKNLDDSAKAVTRFGALYREVGKSGCEEVGKSESSGDARMREGEDAAERKSDDGMMGRWDDGKLSFPSPIVTELLYNIRAALLEDLNTPLALSAALEGLKLYEGKVDSTTASEILGYLHGVQELLGIVPMEDDQQSENLEGAQDDELETAVAELIQKRTDARANKDWGAADAIRDELLAMGVVVEDTPDGPVWKKR